ncbi:MAG: TetR/AcrR family transcriptional regulator [Bryobacteraceae bacterium]
MASTQSSSKSETTAAKILETALDLFRQEGFDRTTMRRIAEKAQLATGAAYYYYPSKDAIVLDFYQRSCDEMQGKIAEALETAKGFETGLSALIRVKLSHFGPNRDVLRALLRNGADPKYPLSPFSAETKAIRDTDLALFQRLLDGAGLRVPRDLRPHLPIVLWFFQMGLIYFWVTDDSPQQARTEKLLPIACRVVATLVRFSSLPFMRPLRKPVVEVIEIATGG